MLGTAPGAAAAGSPGPSGLVWDWPVWDSVVWCSVIGSPRCVRRARARPGRRLPGSRLVGRLAGRTSWCRASCGCGRSPGWRRARSRRRRSGSPGRGRRGRSALITSPATSAQTPAMPRKSRPKTRWGILTLRSAGGCWLRSDMDCLLLDGRWGLRACSTVIWPTRASRSRSMVGFRVCRGRGQRPGQGLVEASAGLAVDADVAGEAHVGVDVGVEALGDDDVISPALRLDGDLAAVERGERRAPGSGRSGSSRSGRCRPCRAQRGWWAAPGARGCCPSPVAASTTLVMPRARMPARPRAIRPPGRPTNAPTSSITPVTVTASAAYAESVTELLMSRCRGGPGRSRSARGSARTAADRCDAAAAGARTPVAAAASRRAAAGRCAGSRRPDGRGCRWRAVGMVVPSWGAGWRGGAAPGRGCAAVAAR